MKYGKYIKSLAFFTILFCMAVSTALGQTRKSPRKIAPKKPIAAPQAKTASALTEISDRDWSAIVSALEKEDWTQAALLSSLALGKLKTEKDKKQIARLRYFYLYASAGKAATGKMSYSELETIARSFIGKEFLMPSRQFLADCKQKLNYICATKDNEKVLRVTATNKSGSAIHSFEYVNLAEKIDIDGSSGKAAFLGGILQKAEINLYKQNISILRLVFDKGFVNLTASR